LKFNLLYFIRLFLRQLPLLLLVPALLAGLVFYLTQDQPRVYYSTVKIYTGIASGTSIELNNSRVDYRAANTAFDNLINIVESRSTLSEVGLRLFTHHMMLKAPDPMIIGPEKYHAIMNRVPKEVKALVVEGDYERTLANFRAYMAQGTDNFLHELIHLRHPDYSVYQIGSKIWVERLSNSDFIELGYESNDPGICQMTLQLLVEVFTRINTELKINSSDDVLQYFQAKLEEAAEQLRKAETAMQDFNSTHNIINYYEQTRHIASQREQTELAYQNVQTNYHGAKAILHNLESRLSQRQRQRLTSQSVLQLRDQLAATNFRMAMLETSPGKDSVKREGDAKKRYRLQKRSDSLQHELETVVDTLYRNDIDQNGLPSAGLLDDWLNTVMEVERREAQLEVYEQKRRDFEKLYATFSPLGAEMKRLERKIDVAEQEYLSILQSLGLAKLKQQNIEMKSNYTIAEPAYYPLIPKESNRMILVAAAAVMGFALTAFAILLLEFLDTNIKTAARAEKKIGLSVTAIFPKLLQRSRRIDMDYLESRATDAILLNVAFAEREKEAKPDKTSVNFLISTQPNDGKSFIAHRLLSKLTDMGYRALYLNYTGEQESQAAAAETPYDYCTYTADRQLYSKAQLSELNEALEPEHLQQYDFIFVEVPPIISKSFPVKLFHEADHIYLLVRANRSWSEADRNALATFREIAPEPTPSILLNGVEVLEMESVLGDLPRRRSWLRRFVKNVIRLRFFSKRQL